MEGFWKWQGDCVLQCSSMYLSIIPAIFVCVSVCLSVCVSATAVSRQPLIRSNWNLPGILLGTWGCAFSRFDINRTSGSQVTATYLSTNDRTRCYDVTIDITINLIFLHVRPCTYGHARTGTRERRNGLCGCFWHVVWKFFCFFFHAWPRTYGPALV